MAMRFDAKDQAGGNAAHHRSENRGVAGSIPALAIPLSLQIGQFERVELRGEHSDWATFGTRHA
jgi:hypothetical protein